MRFIRSDNHDPGSWLFDHAAQIVSLKAAQLPWISPRINMPHLDAAKALLGSAYLSCINQVCTFADDLLFCANHTAEKEGPWEAPWGSKPAMRKTFEAAEKSQLTLTEDEAFWRSLIELRDSLDHFKPEHVVRRIVDVEIELSRRTGVPQYFTTAVFDDLESPPSRRGNEHLQGMLFHGEFLRNTAKHLYLEVSARLRGVIAKTQWKEDQWWMAQRIEYEKIFGFEWSTEALRGSARKYLDQFGESKPMN